MPGELTNVTARFLPRTGKQHCGRRIVIIRHHPRHVSAEIIQLQDELSVQNGCQLFAAWSKSGAWQANGDAPFPCSVVSTSRYRRQPEPNVFRILLGACARKKAVDIVYRARTREIITQFSPHTVVETAQRIHFRGYSPFEAPNGHYWDLVPSRVVSAELSAEGYVDETGDVEWREEVMLQLVLSPDLPPPMRSAVRREHGIEGDYLTLGPLPQALMHYVLADHTHRRYEGYPVEVWLNQSAGSAKRNESDVLSQTP